MLARLLESPTFTRLWLAIALDKETVYSIKTGSREWVNSMSHGQSWVAHTYCPMKECVTWIDRDQLTENHLIDEFLHAVAGVSLEVARKASVPPACAYHGPNYVPAGCADIKEQIERELEKARPRSCPAAKKEQ